MITDSAHTPFVLIECEGIRTTGQPCDRALEIIVPAVDEATGQRITKPQRAPFARKMATSDGWASVKGVDVCPRVHGLIPAPAPKKRRAIE